MRVIKALMAMVIGVVVLAGLVLFLLPTERIANLAAQQFESATGRSLIIDGQVKPSFYPVIGATATDVTLGNPDWAGDGPMAQVAEMDIGLNFGALLSGNIVIERILLQSVSVHLLRDSQGRVNWDFADSRQQDTHQTDATSRDVSLALLRIADSQIRFEDRQAGIDIRATQLDGSLRIPDLQGPSEAILAGRLNNQRFDLNARVAQTHRFLDGAVSDILLEATAAGARLRFDGRAGLENLVAEGHAVAEIPALSPLMQMLGQSAGEVAAAYLPLGYQGQVTRIADGSVYLRDATFRAGGVRLTGALDMRPGDARPKLTGQFAGDVLDLRAAASGGGSGQAGSSGWSQDVIDASALGLFDADLSVSLAGVRTDATTLGRTRLGVSVDRARAVFDLREVALFGGQLTGEFVMNNRSGLSVGGNLRAREIDLLPLLSELADYRRLQGAANADLQFLGVGNSLHAIMNSLRGEGRIALAQGEIIGFDLAGMLRNLDMSYMGDQNRTVYQSVTGTFTISDGVMRNDDLHMEAGQISVVGRGSVGLGARNLDYRIVPAAVRGDDTFRVPLMITGPWDAPRFRLDMEALAREQLRVEQERLEEIAREEARRLEERARTELENRVQRELGVERQEGERVQDTIRRGVEQEIGNRLRGLLGGN